MTRQQAWSKAALSCVNNHKDKSDKAKYRTLCMKAPMYLKQSGLVQALAFLRSRDGEAGQAFVDDLARAYAAGLDPKPEKPLTGRQLLEKAQETGELPLYLALSRDIQAVAVWFRRFAQSELGEGDG